MDRKGPPAIRGLAQCEDARGAFGARNGGRCSLAALVCGVVCCLAWGLRPVRHTPSVGPAVPVPFAAPYLPIRSRLLHATQLRSRLLCRQPTTPPGSQAWHTNGHQGGFKIRRYAKRSVLDTPENPPKWCFTVIIVTTTTTTIS